MLPPDAATAAPDSRAADDEDTASAKTRMPPSGVIFVGLFALLLPLLWLNEGARRTTSAGEAAAAFASAWAYDKLQDIDYDETSTVGSEDRSEQVAVASRVIADGLTPARRDHPVSVTLQGDGQERGDDIVEQTLHVVWDLGQGRRWEYDTVLPLNQRDGRWLPVWSPAVVHPELVPGLVLRADRLRPSRQQVIGAGEQPLVTPQTIVEVGIRPGATDNNRRGTAEDVGRMLGVDVDNLVDRVVDADDDELVPVRTLAQRDCSACARLRGMPGVELRTRSMPMPARADLAPQLLGSVRPADSSLVALDRNRIAPDDLVGVSGLQRTYDHWLAGTPGVEVRAVTAPGSAVAPLIEPLSTVPPVPGRPLRITLRSDIQAAATAAIGGARTPTSIVAVDVDNGDVLAAATAGAGDTSDRTLGGRFPPGWAFTPASVLALLRSGLSPQTPLECPPGLDVAGQRYEAPAGVTAATVQEAFVRGCRTAIAALGGAVSSRDVEQAATLLGYGQADRLGTSAFRGSAPVTDDPVAHTSAMLGEGAVLASPLAVARASATIASGVYQPSRLVLSPVPELEGGTTGGGQSLRDEELFALQEMMRRSVTDTDGTAAALARVPGEVHATCGTASYGPDQPQSRHVWCTGYRGSVAFAILVERSGTGTEAATSVAARFLSAIPRA